MKKKTRVQISSQVFERRFILDRDQLDADAMTVPASISSETPVERFFGSEILVHTKTAINLERANTGAGLPLLLNHDGGQLIGRAKDIVLKSRKLRAILHFSSNSEAARQTWADVQDGFLTDISIRYEINQVQEDKDGDVRVTRWTPMETSVVSVPADATIGINRNHPLEVLTMPETADEKLEREAIEAAKATAAAAAPGVVNLADYTAATRTATLEGNAAGQLEERTRVKAINTVYAMHAGTKGVEELRNVVLNNGTDAARAKDLLLELLGGTAAPVTRTAPQTEGHHGVVIEPIADAADKWTDGVTSALLARGSMIRDDKERTEARQNEFYGMSLIDMARNYLNNQRIALSGLSRMDIAGQAFIRAAGGQHGTSDFSNVLENVANKSMMLGYGEAPETWQQWARRGSLQDFKVASRVNLSSFSDLELILESGEYKEGHISDLKETIQLAKYGKTFTISREAIINDDVNAFTEIPNMMGRAAARQIGDLAYNILTSNPTLNQDATALFHANHNNLGTGGVITEVTLDQFGKLMAAQTSPAPASGETGATLNLSPKFLLVPRAILMAATKVVRSGTAPAPATAGNLTVNTVQNAFEVIWDARLDANSVLIYYGLADPNQADTVEVAFLDGNDMPFIESQNGFTQDGVKFKVRIEAAAAARDFRGMVRNAGA